MQDDNQTQQNVSSSVQNNVQNVDPTAVSNNNAGQVGTVQPVAQPVQQQISTPSGKEVPVVVNSPQSEWVEEVAPEAKVPQEVKDAGVETINEDAIQVEPEVLQAGVTPTGTAVPIPSELTLKLPLTEEKAKGLLGFHKKVRDSITWLAMIVMRQIQQMQLKRKEK